MRIPFRTSYGDTLPKSCRMPLLVIESVFHADTASHNHKQCRTPDGVAAAIRPPPTPGQRHTDRSEPAD